MRPWAYHTLGVVDGAGRCRLAGPRGALAAIASIAVGLVVVAERLRSKSSLLRAGPHIESKVLWCQDVAGSPEPLRAPNASGLGVSFTVVTENLQQDLHGGREAKGDLVMGFQGCEDAQQLIKAGVTGEHLVYQADSALCMAFRKASWSVLGQGQEDIAQDAARKTAKKRGAQWMRLRHKHSRKIVLFVNHQGARPFDSGGACGGNATAGHLMRLISARSHPGDAVVLVGDLRASPESAVVEMLRASFEHVFAVTKDGKVGSSYIFSNVAGAAYEGSDVAEGVFAVKFTVPGDAAEKGGSQQGKAAPPVSTTAKIRGSTSPGTTSTVTTSTTTTAWCDDPASKSQEDHQDVWLPRSTGAAARVKVLSCDLLWWNQPERRNVSGGVSKAVADFLKVKYDIMGFQECVDQSNVSDTVTSSQSGFTLVHSNGTLCTVYRNSTWILVGDGQEDIAQDASSGRYGRRPAQWLRLAHKETAQGLFFLNYHGALPFNSGGACGGRTTARRLLGVVRQHAKHGDAVVLAGAFNSKGYTSEIQELQAHGLGTLSSSKHGGTDFVLSNSPGSAVVATAELGQAGEFHDALGVILEIGAVPKEPWGGDGRIFQTWTTSTATTTTRTTTSTTVTTSTTKLDDFRCSDRGKLPGDGKIWHAVAKGGAGARWKVLTSRMMPNQSTKKGQFPWTSFSLISFQGCANPDSVAFLGKDYGVMLGEFALCMAYKLSDWALLENGHVVVTEESHGKNESHLWRGVQWARLRDRRQNSTLVFLNHEGALPTDSGGSCGSEATAAHLVRSALDYAREGEAVVLSGALRASFGSVIMEQLQQVFAHTASSASLTRVASDDSGGSNASSGGEDLHMVLSNARVEALPSPRGAGDGLAVEIRLDAMPAASPSTSASPPGAPGADSGAGKDQREGGAGGGARRSSLLGNSTDKEGGALRWKTLAAFVAK